MMPPLPDVSIPWTMSSRARCEPAVDSAQSRSSRSASSSSDDFRAALPAILSPAKAGVDDASMSASTKPFSTCSASEKPPRGWTPSATISSASSATSRSSLAFSFDSSASASACAPLLLSPLRSPLFFLPLPMSPSCRIRALHCGKRGHLLLVHALARTRCHWPHARRGAGPRQTRRGLLGPGRPMAALQHGDDARRRGQRPQQHRFRLHQHRCGPRRLRAAPCTEQRRHRWSRHDPGVEGSQPSQSLRSSSPSENVPGSLPPSPSSPSAEPDSFRRP